MAPLKLLHIDHIYLAVSLRHLGSAVFGWLADMTSIQHVLQLTAFLPLLGIVTYLLPNIKEKN